MSKVHVFNAGPCLLPQAALDASIEAIKDFKGTGVSVLCISHRTKEWEATMDECRALWKELLNIPDGYEVLFLGGGASLQFLMAAMNFLEKKAAYLDTGMWAKKALKEAKGIGDAYAIASSADKNYTFIPKGFEIPTDIDYLHITTNNTIYGTEIKKDLDSPAPMWISPEILLCALEISPSVLEFVCTGETKAVAITTEDAWTASTTAEWIGLDQSEGQGDATVGVTLGENPEYVQRQATVAFVTAGGVQTTLIVRQEASPDPHFLEVSPLSFQFGKDGGEAEINIGCDTDWIIGLACDWLSVSQYEGTGNATVSLIAEPNALMEPRTFAFPVKSGDLCFDVSVTQEAGDEQIYAEFSTDTLFVVFNGGLQHLELTSNTSWTLQGSNWISLITSYGEGDASFDIAVNSNPDLEERIGFVNVIHGGQLLDALVVVQEGKQEILEVDVAEIDARPEGGEYTVHITSNLSWTASVDVDWLHCEPTSGFGPKDLTVTVDAMSGLRPRTGRIKIGGSNGAEVSIIVNQH